MPVPSKSDLSTKCVKAVQMEPEILWSGGKDSRLKIHLFHKFCGTDGFWVWSERPREWQMVRLRATLVTVMRW